MKNTKPHEPTAATWLVFDLFITNGPARLVFEMRDKKPRNWHMESNHTDSQQHLAEIFEWCQLLRAQATPYDMRQLAEENGHSFWSTDTKPKPYQPAPDKPEQSTS